MFIATKDIYVSLVITSIFIILVSGLFNENSKYCIVTKPVISQVNQDEYKEALKIVKMYKLQQKKNN